MDLKQGILLKKIGNHSQPLKLKQIIKICRDEVLQHQRIIKITGRL